MLDATTFIRSLLDLGLEFWTGVPDSVLKSFCVALSQPSFRGVHVPAANEGNAIALAFGHYSATGQTPGVYMQNSGLGNAVNPLSSVCTPSVYRAPMVLMIGWRGQPGIQDEPQHFKMGTVTPSLLTLLDIPHLVLDASFQQAQQQVQWACQDAHDRGGPVALLVPQGRFAGLKNPFPTALPLGLSREQAIGTIVGKLPAGSLVVVCTGKAGRELFEIRRARHESGSLDFLNVGGMGHTLQIALGMALGQPKRPVICLDGDGSMLMHMGGLGGVGHCQPKNLIHVVLNNRAHDSVGGQPSLATTTDLVAVAKACGYPHAKADGRDLCFFEQALSQLDCGPYFVELRVDCGARASLGRPDRSSQARQQALLDALRVDSGRIDGMPCAA